MLDKLLKRRDELLRKLDSLFAKDGQGETDYNATEWGDDKQATYDASMKELRESVEPQLAVIDEHKGAHQRAEARAQREAATESGGSRSVDELTHVNLGRAADFREWALNGTPPAHMAAQGITDNKGGFTVPSVTDPELDALLAIDGPMLEVADVRTVSNGQPITVPHVDASAVQAQSVAENTASANASDLAFSGTVLSFDNFATDILPVSRELLEDSAADLDAEITNILASWMGRGLSDALTDGTGGTNIDGFLEHASVIAGVTTAGTTAITTGEIVTLRGSIYPPYRRNMLMMFNQATETYLQGLVASAQSAAPIISPSIREQDQWRGVNMMCAGVPYVLNEKMDSIATKKKVIAIGDFRMVRVYQTGPYELLRFTDSPYATKRQVGFMMQCRRAGKLATATGATGTRQPIKHLALK